MRFEKKNLSRSFRLTSVVSKEVRLFKPLNSYEREWLENCFRRASTREFTLYYVMGDSALLVGLYALSLANPENRSNWLVIDFLYVLPEFRGTPFEDSPFKASELILAEIMIQAQKISEIVNLSIVALQLGHDNLQRVYEQMGFVVLKARTKKSPDLWMGITFPDESEV